MMNRKLSFEQFFQELNRSESHKGDLSASEEQEDLGLILAMEKLLAIGTELYFQTRTQETAQCLTDAEMRKYFDPNTSDQFKQTVKQHLIKCPRCFDQLTDYHLAHIETLRPPANEKLNKIIELKPKPVLAMAADTNQVIAEFEADIYSAEIWQRQNEDVVLELHFEPDYPAQPHLSGQRITVSLVPPDALSELGLESTNWTAIIDENGYAEIRLGTLPSKTIDMKLQAAFENATLRVNIDS